MVKMRADAKDGVKVKADTTDAERKLADTDASLKRLGASRTTAKVTADTTDAILKLIPLTDKLTELRDRVNTAKVDANTDAAKAKLEALDLTLRRVGTITARPRVSLQGVEEADIRLDSVALKLAALSAAGSGGRGGGVSGALHSLGGAAPSAMALGIGAASTAVLPLAGVVAGLGASLLTPLTAATVGIGAFGLAAKSTYTTVAADVTTLTGLQTAYNAATSNKTRAAAHAAELKFWNSLSKPQQQAVTNLHKLSAEWSKFQKALAPEIYPLISGGVGLANSALKALLPTATATGKALDGIERSVTGAFKDPFWHQFFGSFLPGEATKATEAFATSLGNLTTGGAHLVQDFAPLGHSFEGGMVRLSKDFENWTTGKGPAQFVAWVHKNSPQITHDVGELASGVTKVAEALVPVGTKVLHDVGAVAGVIGKFSGDHPAAVKDLAVGLLAVGTSLKVIAGAEKAIAVLSVLSKLGGGAGLGGLGAGAAEGAGGGLLAGAGGGLLAGGGSAALEFALPVAAAYAGQKLINSVNPGTALSPQQAAMAKLAPTIVAAQNAVNKALGIGVGLSKTSTAAVDKYAQSLLAEGVPLKFVKSLVDDYVSSLHKVPSGVHTKITADTASAEAGLRRLEAMLSTLAGQARAGLITFQQLGNVQRGGGSIPAPPQHHHGSGKKLTAGHPTVVGPLAHTSHLPGWLTGTGSTSPNAATTSTSSSGSSGGSSGTSGPSSATVGNAIASIVNYAGLTFLTGLEGTSKQINSGITTMIDRLNTAVRDHYLTTDKSLVASLRKASGPLAALATQEVVTAHALTTAQAALSSLKGQAASTRTGTLSSFQSLGDIGQIAAGTSVAGVISVLGKQDKVGAAFARNLAILRKKGLDDQAYIQLLNEGPATAGQEVAVLATATRGQIHRINTDEARLGALGHATGTASSTYLFGARIKAQAADVHALRLEDHQLLALQKQTAKDLATVVKDGIKDPGTHKGLDLLHKDLRDVIRALNTVGGAPKQAAHNRRTKVSR